MMKQFYLEGNNGGDYIYLKQYKPQEKNNTVYVEIGHCCVVIARHEIPVELLPNLFYKAVMESNGNMQEVVRQTLEGHSKDYIEERISVVQEWEGR